MSNFTRIVKTPISNSLIIHDVVTQPERLTLVRWMKLELKLNEKRVENQTCLETISNPCVKCFLFCIHKARPTHEDKTFIFNHRVTIQYTLEQAYLLPKLNVTVSKYQNK